MEVASSSICGTDLNFMAHGSTGLHVRPRVRRLRRRDRLTPSSRRSPARSATQCRAGYTQRCIGEHANLGIFVDGGLADRVRVPPQNLVAATARAGDATTRASSNPPPSLGTECSGPRSAPASASSCSAAGRSVCWPSPRCAARRAMRPMSRPGTRTSARRPSGSAPAKPAGELRRRHRSRRQRIGHRPVRASWHVPAAAWSCSGVFPQTVPVPGVDDAGQRADLDRCDGLRAGADGVRDVEQGRGDARRRIPRSPGP